VVVMDLQMLELNGIEATASSAREREVLDLLATDRNNHQIAEQLGLSGKTVTNHISAIFAKLQVADRTQAILRARDAGLGHP
jgi:DNA-binding NarL/FixJ family response regulator